MQTDGCSGAEITALCQEAALLTMQNDMNALHVGPSLIIGNIYSLNSIRCHTKHLLSLPKQRRDRLPGRFFRGMSGGEMGSGARPFDSRQDTFWIYTVAFGKHSLHVKDKCPLSS